MADKEFNLLDEKWIRVIDDKCSVSEVSLKELFSNAHLYKDLCGELPTQDFAILRLLLAVLHTVFSRYDTNGEENPLEDPDDALDRWSELWESKKFPDKPILDYLESQRENFYLFHPERPFYQAEHAKVGTEYTAPKLNGALSESSNKVRLFQCASGQAKELLTFSEAARWLINVNAFDDTSAKPSSESKKRGIKLPSVGAGWLGKLGLICLLGKNLFETLMLNLVLLNSDDELFEDEKPVWEQETFPDKERVKIIMPDNLSQLYTLQSRRLFLKREGKGVAGYYLLGGDFFDKENAFIEPMTVWKNTDNKQKDEYVPKRHNSAKQFWNDFSSLVRNDDKYQQPGVISWINFLEDKNILTEDLLNIKIAAVEYGDKDFFIENTFSDSLQFHSGLIMEMNSTWQTMIQHCIDFCDEISKKIWTFAKDVNRASGGDFIPEEDKCSAKVAAQKAKSDFYNRIDVPFRKWLCELDPTVDIASEKETEWRKRCVDIALKLGEEMIADVPSSAIFGKVKSDDSDKKTKPISVANAYKWFVIGLTKAKNE